MSPQPYGRKKRSNTTRSFIFMVFIVACVAVFYGLFDTGGGPVVSVETLPVPGENEIRVCFFDVGQGDAILIQTADNAVLIDAGEYSARRRLLAYIREAGVETFDYVIATHPHNDHIGGITPVINNFNVKNIAMPDAVNNTATFENLLKLIDEKNIPLTVPKAGDTLRAGKIELKVLSPENAAAQENVNNAGLVLRMTHGDTVFLFMADVEWQAEREILDSGRDVRANVMKAGHHGSRTATTEAFLDAVKPNAVVISCGANNQYGHPHPEVLEALSEPSRNIMTLRTDEMGNIVMLTDGTEIKLFIRETSGDAE